MDGWPSTPLSMTAEEAGNRGVEGPPIIDEPMLNDDTATLD